MSKQLALSVLIELPDDIFAASEVTQSLHATWHGLVETLKGRPGLVFKHNEDVLEVRAKVARRPRKPRLVTTNPPDAA